jgi:hypothetical protein
MFLEFSNPFKEMIMDILFVFASLVLTTVSFAEDGTVSVLANNETPAAAPAVVVVSAPVACCEEARTVKLSPWVVRRLNRVADRQEAREDRCCCRCKGCDSAKTLVLESRKKTCDCR